MRARTTCPSFRGAGAHEATRPSCRARCPHGYCPRPLRHEGVTPTQLPSRAARWVPLLKERVQKCGRVGAGDNTPPPPTLGWGPRGTWAPAHLRVRAPCAPAHSPHLGRRACFCSQPQIPSLRHTVARATRGCVILRGASAPPRVQLLTRGWGHAGAGSGAPLNPELFISDCVQKGRFGVCLSSAFHFIYSALFLRGEPFPAPVTELRCGSVSSL